jgi:nucleotide-binding universal stress UspA family protein
MTNVIQNILYAADLGDDGEPVLAYAIDLANRLGAHLQVLTVIPDQREKSLIDAESYVPQAELDKYHDERARRVKEHIEAQIAAFYAVRAEQKPARPVTEVAVREGDDVAQLILEQARTNASDLIVMGSRGEGVLVGLLFGSVAQELTRKARTPLLLVPVRG